MKLGPDVVAIAGKTLRRADQKGGATAAIHMVSPIASNQRIVLGQIEVAGNRTRSQPSRRCSTCVARHVLLDMLAVTGSIRTIDAMACQREIAGSIVEKEADYALAPKGKGNRSRNAMVPFSFPS